ncbi:MAG: 5'/3'-nucleotidase SurE [Acidilobus sp.]
MLNPVTRALITNDDGIDSVGLRYLVEELSTREFEVYVVAPRSQVSGAAKSNSFRVKVTPVKLEGTKGAWAIDGKPADAVAIALKALLPEKPDIVISGINIGPNMGITDFFTSGTIGAAIEAALLGVRAVASSYAVLRGIGEDDKPHIRKAAMITAEVAERLSRNPRAPEGLDIVLLNFPRGNPRGVRIASMALISNIEIYNGEEEGVYHVLGWRTDNLDEAYTGEQEGTDVDLVKKGYVAVTPICLKCLTEATSNAALTAGLITLLRDLLG